MSSCKPFLKVLASTVDSQLLTLNCWAATVDPQPLRRLITPIGFGDNVS